MKLKDLLTVFPEIRRSPVFNELRKRVYRKMTVPVCVTVYMGGRDGEGSLSIFDSTREMNEFAERQSGFHCVHNYRDITL
jgi:hypothetical protein